MPAVSIYSYHSYCIPPPICLPSTLLLCHLSIFSLAFLSSIFLQPPSPTLFCLFLLFLVSSFTPVLLVWFLLQSLCYLVFFYAFLSFLSSCNLHLQHSSTCYWCLHYFLSFMSLSFNRLLSCLLLCNLSIFLTFLFLPATFLSPTLFQYQNTHHLLFQWSKAEEVAPKKRLSRCVCTSFFAVGKEVCVDEWMSWVYPAVGEEEEWESMGRWGWSRFVLRCEAGECVVDWLSWWYELVHYESLVFEWLNSCWEL